MVKYHFESTISVNFELKAVGWFSYSIMIWMQLLAANLLPKSKGRQIILIIAVLSHCRKQQMATMEASSVLMRRQASQELSNQRKSIVGARKEAQFPTYCSCQYLQLSPWTQELWVEIGQSRMDTWAVTSPQIDNKSVAVGNDKAEANADGWPSWASPFPRSPPPLDLPLRPPSPPNPSHGRRVPPPPHPFLVHRRTWRGVAGCAAASRESYPTPCDATSAWATNATRAAAALRPGPSSVCH